MTEEEAKTKLCPAAYGRSSQPAYCIGSACMAFRWADEIERRWTQEPPEGEGRQRVEAIGGVAHWARTHKTPHGYCGLAGEP